MGATKGKRKRTLSTLTKGSNVLLLYKSFGIEVTMDDVLKKIEEYLSLLDCNKKKIILSINNIAKFDPSVADQILDNCDEIYRDIELLAKERHKHCTGKEEEMSVYFQPENLIELIEWGKAHLDTKGKLRRVWGTVISIAPIQGHKVFIYYCEDETCNKHYYSARKMKKCPGGNGHILALKKERNFCYRDLVLLEQRESGLSQEKIRCRMYFQNEDESNIVDFYNLLGRRVEIAGYIEEVPLPELGYKQLYGVRFVAKGIKTKEIVKLTKKDIEECQQFIHDNRENLLDLLSEEIWYGTYSYKAERKLMLLHALGLNKTDKDLDAKSKQMCLMIVSDKGRNKSQMAKALLKYFPGGDMVTASSTSAGLLVGLEKTSSGEFTASLGDIPACNNSICVLEEVDKYREGVDALLTVLSDGLIKTSKIKKFHMECHINFIALANPKHGHFDLQLPYYSQIDLPEPFIDRMDSIIILPLAYDKHNKIEFARKILNPTKGVKRKLSDEFLTKLLFYMKNYLPNPKLTDDGELAIANKWDSLEDMYKRAGSEGVGDIKTIEARAVVSILKVCKAYGRMHLCPEITADVVELAYDVMFKGSIQKWLKDYGQYGVESFGVYSKESGKLPKIHNDDDRRQFIINLLEAKPDGMDIDQLIQKLKGSMEMTTAKAQTLIKQLLRADEISETNGILKRKWSKGVQEEFVSSVSESFDIKAWVLKRLDENPMSDIEIVGLAKEELQLADDLVFKTIEKMVTEGELLSHSKDGKLRVV